LSAGNCTEREQEIIFGQFQEQYEAIGLVAQLLANNSNAQTVFQTGLKILVDNQNNSLVDAMTRRMTANLVKMPGIQGGGQSGKPVGVDGSRSSTIAQLEDATGTTETGGATDRPRPVPQSVAAEIHKQTGQDLDNEFPTGKPTQALEYQPQTPAIGFTPQQEDSDNG
jgi:hypothetical protein